MDHGELCWLTHLMSFKDFVDSLSIYITGAAYCCGNLGHGVPTWSCNACGQNPGSFIYLRF
jgi:hypothetical protein